MHPASARQSHGYGPARTCHPNGSLTLGCTPAGTPDLARRPVPARPAFAIVF